MNGKLVGKYTIVAWMLYGIFFYKWTKKARRFKQLRSPQARSKSLWLTLPLQILSNHPFPMPHQLPCPIDFLATCGFPDKQGVCFDDIYDRKSTPYSMYYICDKLSPALNLQNSCDFLIESFSMDNNNILPILLICSSLSMGQIIIQLPIISAHV